MRTRILVAALAVALLLAGCSSGGTRDDGRITLRFLSLAWQEESVEAGGRIAQAHVGHVGLEPCRPGVGPVVVGRDTHL